MGKQYTFKTTKNTEWLEDVLNNMSGRERSEFIRAAIISYLTKTTPTNVDTRGLTSDKRSDNKSVKDLEVQEMGKFCTQNVSDSESDNWSDFEVIGTDDEQDLDNILDNIIF